MMHFFVMLLTAAGTGGGLHLVIAGTGLIQLVGCVFGAMNIALCAYNIGKALKD